MATNTLTDRATGQTILEAFFNDIHDALNGDLVGRNSSGVATAGQNLGTLALGFGTVYADNISLNGSALDTSQLVSPRNRIVSGKTRSASNQPQFIDPNGAAASFVLEGAATNLVLDIDAATVTVSTDITKSSLTVGPSTTATALVNDVLAADQAATRIWGEDGVKTITIDNMGAEFQTYIGQWVAIQIAGVATEYALAFVKSTTELTDCYRGYFYNSSGAPVNRTAFFDNDVITVLSTAWVFIENDGATVDVSYTNPIRSFTSPTGPATGDYWYDLANNTWKRYDGASFEIINRTLIGVAAVDATNCVAARSFDFYGNYDELNNIKLQVNSTEIIEVKDQGSKVNVYGNEFNFGFNHENWNISTDLAGSADMYNATEQASTYYYLYLKDTGAVIISDIEPHNRPDLKGKYHPHNPWRLIGESFNDGSSNIVTARGDVEKLYIRYNSDSGQVVTDGNPIIFEDLYEENSREYSSTTGIFTARRALSLLVSTDTRLGSSAASFVVTMEKNSVDVKTTTRSGLSTTHSASLDDVISVVAGDTIKITNTNTRTISSVSIENVITFKEL